MIKFFYFALTLYLVFYSANNNYGVYNGDFDGLVDVHNLAGKNTFLSFHF